MQRVPFGDLLKLRPRSNTLHVSQNRTVMAMARDGFIDRGPQQGLIVDETRLLSQYQYRINGEVPLPVALSNLEQHTWLGYYIHEPPGVDLGPKDEGSGMMKAISQQTLELRLSRQVADGVHEDVDVTNFTQETTEFLLEIDLEADFADISETEGDRKQWGTISREWRQDDGGIWELAFDYHVEHRYQNKSESGHVKLNRGVKVRVLRSDSPAEYRRDRIAFSIILGPRERWHACIELAPVSEHRQMKPLVGCYFTLNEQNEFDRKRSMFLNEATRFKSAESETLASVVVGGLERAKEDLAAMRLYDLDGGDRDWTMAAGLPIYVALYGRDVLTAGWQAAPLGPEMMRGALRVVANLQGKEINDWREEQPGRMLHEAHPGPLSMLGFNPRSRYYGAVTTSVFYPVVVSELWHWTGDKALVAPFIEPALRGLEWVEKYAHLNDDAFFDYQSRSTQGTYHQGWKDSADAIVYDDGSPVRTPISTSEEQGFVYIAKLHMAEVLWWFDRKDEAKRLFREASELKKQFNDVFWLNDIRFLAMGLDPEKKPIRSIGSNAGHCIATGIVDKAIVQQIADRLLEPDLFSGWGVRTLNTKNPAYNPYSYHRGSVWPVEHGTFSLGCMRYGLFEHMERICRSQFEAAAIFEAFRLPEVYSGHQRDEEHPFPALYPRANWPQAWSASSLFSHLQAMLGLYPYAPLNMLLVDPHLPPWLPEITLTNLRVGEAAIDLHFFRKSDGSSDYRIIDKRGTLYVLWQASPWSLTESFGERVKEMLLSLTPSRQAG